MFNQKLVRPVAAKPIKEREEGERRGKGD